MVEVIPNHGNPSIKKIMVKTLTASSPHCQAQGISRSTAKENYKLPKERYATANESCKLPKERHVIAKEDSKLPKERHAIAKESCKLLKECCVIAKE
jgi:hypothetical protein